MPKRQVDRRAAGLVFALLVLATLAAFAYAQRAKREPLVLDRVRFVAAPAPRDPEAPRLHAFTPNGDCRHDTIRIRFRTTVSDHGTVQVIKPGGRVVITLARDTFLKRYRFHTYFWDGRQRGGGIAPPGRYKLRVRLGDRVLVTPGVIALHPSPPGRKSACSTPGGGGGLKAAGA
ncbi:MAG TPA: hypothetical protein VFJ99_01965 [Solirubrobacterales bacterium]|nr:hypothetical protein [Solirubrobacterales bacterium]